MLLCKNIIRIVICLGSTILLSSSLYALELKYPNGNSIETISSENNILLENTYTNSEFKYSIKYPAGWKYSIEKQGLVIFSGKPGTQFHQTSFLVQVLTQNPNHETTQDVVDIVKKVLIQKTKDFKIVEQGNMEFLNNNPDFEGQYLIYKYKIKNQPVGHLEIVTFYKQTKLLYIFDYIVPASRFKTDLPIAKAMLESFTVYPTIP